MKEPIQPGAVGLLLDRNNLTVKGIIVHVGVIDSDYTWEIIIANSLLTGCMKRKREHGPASPSSF